MQTPLVSVVISTYNAEQHIAACLANLQSQTLAERMEIIVIDSGSQQNERAIVEKFQREGARLVYLRTERESLYAAWNRGLALARGVYFTNANTDDALRDDALEKMTAALEQFPEADLAYGHCSWTSKPNSARPIERTIHYPPYHPAYSLFYCFTGCFQFWRRTVFEKIGLFDARLRAVGDYEMLLRFARARLRAVLVPEVLSWFYQNPSGLSQHQGGSLLEEMAVRNRYRMELPIDCLFKVDPAEKESVANAWVTLGGMALSVRVPWHEAPLQDRNYAWYCFTQALQAVPNHPAALHNIAFLLDDQAENDLTRQQLLKLLPSETAQQLTKEERAPVTELLVVEARAGLEPLVFHPEVAPEKDVPLATISARRGEPMRILYEISTLGTADQNQSARSGIFRVVENVALALLASEECQLKFCVLEPDNLKATQACLQPPSPLASVPFSASPEMVALSRKTERIKLAAEQRGHKTLREKIVLEFLRLRKRWLVDPKEVLDKNDLSWAHVLHLPFYIENPYRQNNGRLIQFQTVYDLIPILFPNFFDDRWAQNFLKKKLSSPGPQQWFLAISNSTRNDLCHLAHDLDPERVMVTHLAAADFFRPCLDREHIDCVLKKYGIPPEPYLLSVCTLEPRKNLPHAIQCWGRLIREEKIRDLNFVLVGAKGWQYDRIFEEAGGCSELRNRVLFTGYVPDEDLSPLYSGALGFVYMSLYEGFGLPVLEAMQCGTPVITSNNSSLPEVVGNAGILLDAQDQDSLCQAMHLLWLDADLRQTLRERGLQKARQFSWANCARQTLAAYAKALDATGR